MSNKRIVRFPLVLSDRRIRQTEELKEITITQEDAERILRYFIEGKLEKWLNDRYENEKAEYIRKLRENLRSESLKEVFNILEIAWDESLHLPNINDVNADIEQHKRVEQLTSDKRIIDNYRSVIFSQEQFDERIQTESILYLAIKELHFNSSQTYSGHKYSLFSIGNINGITITTNDVLSEEYHEIFAFENFQPIFPYDEKNKREKIEKLVSVLAANRETEVQTSNSVRLSTNLVLNSTYSVGDTITLGCYDSHQLVWVVTYFRKDDKMLLLLKDSLPKIVFRKTDSVENLNNALKNALQLDTIPIMINDRKVKLDISILSKKDINEYVSKEYRKCGCSWIIDDNASNINFIDSSGYVNSISRDNMSQEMRVRPAIWVHF